MSQVPAPSQLPDPDRRSLFRRLSPVFYLAGAALIVIASLYWESLSFEEKGDCVRLIYPDFRDPSPTLPMYAYSGAKTSYYPAVALPPLLRAVTLPVDRKGLPDGVTPNTRVDVMLTTGDEFIKYCEPVIKDVLVMSVDDHRLSITLAVTPEDGDRLLDALENGALLSVAVRPQSDNQFKVVVTRMPLPVGKIIDNPQEYFDLQMYNKDYVPKNSFTDIAQLKGRQIKIARRAWDPITEDDLVEVRQRVEVQPPPGYRAVVLPIGMGAAAEVQADTKEFLSWEQTEVNLVWIPDSDVEARSRPLIGKALVLAAEQFLSGSPLALKRTMTLAVTPDDAASLAKACDSGIVLLSRAGNARSFSVDRQREKDAKDAPPKK